MHVCARLWEQDREERAQGCNLVNHEIVRVLAWLNKSNVTVAPSPSLCHFSIRVAGISPYPNPIAVTLRSVLLFQMSSLRTASVKAPTSGRTAPGQNKGPSRNIFHCSSWINEVATKWALFARKTIITYLETSHTHQLCELDKFISSIELFLVEQRCFS